MVALAHLVGLAGGPRGRAGGRSGDGLVMRTNFQSHDRNLWRASQRQQQQQSRFSRVTPPRKRKFHFRVIEKSKRHIEAQICVFEVSSLERVAVQFNPMHKVRGAWELPFRSSTFTKVTTAAECVFGKENGLASLLSARPPPRGILSASNIPAAPSMPPPLPTPPLALP